MKVRSFANCTSLKSKMTGLHSSNQISIGSATLSTCTSTLMSLFMIRSSIYRRRPCLAWGSLYAIISMKRCIVSRNLLSWRKSGSFFSWCARFLKFTRSNLFMVTSSRAISLLHLTINYSWPIKSRTSRHTCRRKTWKPTICTLESRTTTKSAILPQSALNQVSQMPSSTRVN